MTTVNKFLGAVCLPTDRGLCLPFRRKKSIEQIWVPEKSLAKYRQIFTNHLSFQQLPVSSVRGQGGMLAPTHLLAFILESLVLQVNQGKHNLTWNSWSGMWSILERFAQLCHGQGLRGPTLQPIPTPVVWGFAAGLALCTAKILQPLPTPVEGLVSEGGKCGVSSERDQLPSRRTPSWDRAQKRYWNEIAGK